MATSPNGWPLIPPGDPNAPKLRRFAVPVGLDSEIVIPDRDGSAGFLLVYYLTWFDRKIEPLQGNPPDDWGYAYRPNKNNPGVWSNHASGTAVDSNSAKHPNGVRNTFTLTQRTRIRLHLRRYRGCLRSGIFYTHTPDDMHTEIDKDLRTCERRARKLMRTKRGKMILAANPGLAEVILS